MGRFTNIYAVIFMLTGLVVLVAGSRNRLWSIPKLGKCDEQRLKLLMLIRRGFQDVDLPLCDVDGWYMPRYYCSWTGICFCIDRRGKHIVARGGPPNLSTKSEETCNQHRQKALDQIKAGMLSVELPECEYPGDRYKAGYHCCQGRCYCIDEYGKKTYMSL